MPYLESLVEETPVWASVTGLDELRWQELVSVLKAMWHRYKNVKNRKDADITVSLSRTIYDSYLDFEKEKMHIVIEICK